MRNFVSRIVCTMRIVVHHLKKGIEFDNAADVNCAKWTSAIHVRARVSRYNTQNIFHHFETVFFLSSSAMRETNFHSSSVQPIDSDIRIDSYDSVVVISRFSCILPYVEDVRNIYSFAKDIYHEALWKWMTKKNQLLFLVLLLCQQSQNVNSSCCVVVMFISSEYHSLSLAQNLHSCKCAQFSSKNRFA